MTSRSENVHGTAITIDGVGLLFLGPSGSGKSALAFDCLAEAGLASLPGGLISDDRVIIRADQGRIFAMGPEQIQGLIELRYTGIVSVSHVSEAELHYVVRPVPANEAERLPPENEHVDVIPGHQLPVIRLPVWSRFPLNLVFARIRSLEANG